MKTPFIKIAGAALALSMTMAAAANSAGNAFVVTNPTMKTECSACHTPYAPGFLPKRSWKAIMSDLSNHFGEDASLDAASTKEITDYLMATAPENIRGIDPNITVLRITQEPWFTARHTQRFVDYAKSHSNIGSISNCTGCHRGAERGIFEDD